MERKSLSALPEKFNIVEELLEKNVRATPKATALHLVSPESLQVSSTISYEELTAASNKVGNALVSAGVEEEQRVAIMLNDGPEFVETFLGAMKVGAVPILFSTYLSEEQLLYLLNDSRAKALFLEDEFTPKLSGIKGKLDFTKRIISPKGSSGLSFHEFMGDESQHLEMKQTSKDDVAFWFFTSGSTGLPKGVVHLHHDLYYAGLSYYDDVLHALAGDKFLSGAKLYFSAGLGFGLYGPLIMGASSVLYPGKPSAKTMLEIIRNTRPTAFLCVPTLYTQMLQNLSKETADLSSVRIFATGGESLSPKTFVAWKKKTGVEITEAIGAAEICHHYISNVLNDARPGSCGKLMAGYEAKIVDSKLNEIGPEEIGILLVKGESTFAYYWHMHDATRRTILGEWVDTGDLFFKDREGYFYFCGRKDFSFKIHGLWVSPIEIENAILDTGLVKECCVVDQSGSDGISIPIAFVVPELDSSKDLETSIGRKLEMRLSKYKIPKKFVFVDSLAKTTVGKLDRSEIRRRAGATLQS